MGKRYHSGGRAAALKKMAECAIRDREAMIDGLTPPWGAELSEKDAEYKEKCRADIEDFKRLLSLSKSW